MKSDSRYAYCMKPLRVNFIIGQLSEQEVAALIEGHVIISKMILSAGDYKLFLYKEGDLIQVETQQGNRLWCTIKDLEIVENKENIIIIFSLKKAPANGRKPKSF